MPRGNRRDEIRQVAERLFTQRRFHEVTLDDVAHAAKIGKGTIYQYFKDKDDLFYQVVMAGFTELCELLHQRVSETAPFAEQLRDASLAIRAFFTRRRQLVRMMQNEDEGCRGLPPKLQERWRQHRKELVAAVAAIMAKGVTEGALRQDLPAEVLATLLLGMLRAQARDLTDMDAPWQQPELVVELFCRGAAAQPKKRSK